MPSDHPFQQLFETFGKLPDAHSESVNRDARKKVKAWLDAPIGDAGHCILLKAPRAGHGKTHLLTRLQHELGGSHEFIPLHAVGGSRIDAATVLEDTLRRLVRALPAAGGLAVLDLVARRLFSISLQPLVNSGEVPCQDREAALVALRDRPIETFDFHHPGAVTAHWAKENFELLGPRLALELSQRNALPLREVSFWVDALFRFAATPIENPGRARMLTSQVFDGPSAEAAAHERLVALLVMLTTLLRVVLVADELEGFSLDESAALRFASFIASLRQSVDRADVILSLNQDVWESAFLPRLSGGLADRLSEVTVEIEPLDRQGMIALIESRVPGEGERILSGVSATYARAVIREAAEVWSRKGANEPISPFSEQPVVPAYAPPIGTPATSFVVEPPAPMFNEEPPAPIPATVPLTFSPEAAIAAFKSFPEPIEIPVETPPPVASFPEENTWPSPAVIPHSVFPPTDDFVPLATTGEAFQSDRNAVDVDSPFSIDSVPAADPIPSQIPMTPLSGEGAPLVEAPHASAAESSTDRVDDLLRQFRERYGKS